MHWKFRHYPSFSPLFGITHWNALKSQKTINYNALGHVFFQIMENNGSFFHYLSIIGYMGVGLLIKRRTKPTPTPSDSKKVCQQQNKGKKPNNIIFYGYSFQLAIAFIYIIITWELIRWISYRTHCIFVFQSFITTFFLLGQERKQTTETLSVHVFFFPVCLWYTSW